jgi:transcriptional regulator with XRE-family HTH domain
MAGKRLGEKVREDRKALGWTLKDLASKVGISITTLQRIETNVISPSVDLMVKIAGKLRKPVSSYILDKKTTSAIIKSKEFKVFKEKGQTLRMAPAKEIIPLDLSLFHLVAAEGSAAELHSQEGYKGAIILKGKMKIEQEGQILEISAGDAYLLDAHYPYSEQFLEETEAVGLFLSA